MTHPSWSVWSLHLWLSKLTSLLDVILDYLTAILMCRVDVQRSLKLFINKTESLASLLQSWSPFPFPASYVLAKPHHHPLKNLKFESYFFSLSHHLISWPACPVASTFKTSHVCSFLFTFSSISQVKATVIFIWATQWSSDSNLIGLLLFLKDTNRFSAWGLHINCFLFLELFSWPLQD